MTAIVKRTGNDLVLRNAHHLVLRLAFQTFHVYHVTYRGKAYLDGPVFKVG